MGTGQSHPGNSWVYKYIFHTLLSLICKQVSLKLKLQPWSTCSAFWESFRHHKVRMQLKRTCSYPLNYQSFDPLGLKLFPTFRKLFCVSSPWDPPIPKIEVHLLLCRWFRYIEIFRSSSSECRRSTIFNTVGRNNGGGDGGGFNNDRGFNGRGQRNTRTNFRGRLFD